jgi:hypothetical protein
MMGLLSGSFDPSEEADLESMLQELADAQLLPPRQVTVSQRLSD